MNPQTTHISDTELEALAYGDETGQATQAAAAHVEDCSSCLRRLLSLTQPADFQDSAARFLSDFPPGETTTTGPRRKVRETTAASSTGDQWTTAQTEALQRWLQPAAHPELLGRLGRYNIEQPVGRGGMGIVLKGFDTELNRPVAVKILAEHLAYNGAARQRFAREARAAAAVVHEHVVAIHDVETDGEAPYLVMQYVAGESLQNRVDRDGPLDLRQILRIAIQAASGLSAAHEQGVVHRDIKPANILLEHHVERVLLTDFGLARTVDDASLTHTGIITGTPHYMSPEQASGETCDHRTDLFSLGAVLYFMATGRPPFRAEKAIGVLHRICNDRYPPVWSLNPDVPDEVCDVIDRLLEKKPHRRFASATAARDALVKILERVQQPRRRWIQQLRRSLRRQQRRDWLLLTAGVAAMTAVLLSSGTPPEDDSSLPDLTHPTTEAANLPSEGPPAPAGENVASGTTPDPYAASAGPTTGATHRSNPFPANPVELEVDFRELQSRLQQSELSQQTAYENPARSDWDQQIQTLHEELDALNTSLNQTPLPPELQERPRAE